MMDTSLKWLIVHKEIIEAIDSKPLTPNAIGLN